MPASKPWVGINAEVARGIKERVNGRRLLRYGIHRGTKQTGDSLRAREATGCYQVMGLVAGDGQRFTGTVPVWPARYMVIGRVRSTRYLPRYYTIKAAAKLRALGRSDPDPCCSMPCRENWVKRWTIRRSRRQLCSAQCKGWSVSIPAIRLCCQAA